MFSGFCGQCPEPGSIGLARRDREGAVAEMGVLTDQVCIVSGAGQGLGRVSALEMVAEGATVALLERNGETVSKVAAEISDADGRAVSYVLDVTDYAAYRDAVADVLQKFGRIDTLVNNAASTGGSSKSLRFRDLLRAAKRDPTMPPMAASSRSPNRWRSSLARTTSW